MEYRRDDTSAILADLKRDLSAEQLELLEKFLAALRDDVQAVLRSQGRALSDISGLLSGL